MRIPNKLFPMFYFVLNIHIYFIQFFTVELYFMKLKTENGDHINLQVFITLSICLAFAKSPSHLIAEKYSNLGLIEMKI